MKKTKRRVAKAPGSRARVARAAATEARPAPLWTAPPDFAPVRPGAVTPMRTVPASITRPDYALLGKPARPKALNRGKTPEEIERMRHACTAAAEVLQVVSAAARPGVTTEELDVITHDACVERGGYPSPLNYHGYPKSLCTSANEIICHGIPDSRALQDGDIVNLDVTIFLEGMHGDTSATVLIGDVAPDVRKLVEVTYECMMRGIKTVRPGGRIRDIGAAIESHASKYGYGVVTDFVGHGVGEQFHMLPNVPHYYDPGATTEMTPGMTFTIEPMITMGTSEAVVWDDNWTAVTADLSPTAQFEHSVLVTERGVEILTLPPGEVQPFPH